VVWREEVGGRVRAGLAFEDVPADARRALVRLAFSAEEAFADAHASRTRSQLVMAAQLVLGLVRAFQPLRTRRRLAPRRRSLRPVTWVGGRGRRALVIDASDGGLGLLVLGERPEGGSALPVLSREEVRWARVVHVRGVLPGVSRVGLCFLPGSLAASEAHAYLAA
jgi:hypothetical protein